jgi:hypothetical protein
MKRGFLFGLASFLILMVIDGIVEIFTARGIGPIILTLIFMPLSVAAIRAANRAPSNKSKLHAVGGWILGFLSIDAGALILVFGIWAFSW